MIGAWPTILLIILTALLGASLFRMQGFATLQRARGVMAQGQLPAIEMLEGMFLIVSGALLLTPGFFTDAVGFLFLVPPLRRFFITQLLGRGILRAAGVNRSNQQYRGSSSSDSGPKTLEGEFWRDDDK